MKNVLIFVAGAATGAFVTYKFVAKYYKDESDKEIQSVIDTFNERKNNLREEIKKENEMKVEKENKTNKKEDKEQNATIIHTENYGSVDVETAAEQLINMSPEDAANFIIIHPNDYGDQDDYELKSWLLWSDGVLTDDNDEIIENPSEFIGDALSHFGDYEDDSVYVRNRADKIDYEILKTEREYEY